MDLIQLKSASLFSLDEPKLPGMTADLSEYSYFFSLHAIWSDFSNSAVAAIYLPLGGLIHDSRWELEPRSGDTDGGAEKPSSWGQRR
jgi:hypothetical protein